MSEIDDLPNHDNETLALEWLVIRSRHDAWVYYGLQDTATEKLARATVRMSV